MINASILIGASSSRGSQRLASSSAQAPLYTRVIAVVLMLIAFTLAPVILDLIIDGGGAVPATHAFSFGLVFAITLFVANGVLKGIWRSTLALWAIILGTLAYVLLFGAVPLPPEGTALFALPGNLLAPLAVPEVGVLVAF